MSFTKRRFFDLHSSKASDSIFMPHGHLLLQVPTEQLIRLLTIMERHIRDGFTVQLSSLAEQGEEEEQRMWRDICLDRMLRSVEASLVVLNVLTSPSMPKLLYLEEVMDRIIRLTKIQLQNTIFPEYDLVYRDPDMKGTSLFQIPSCAQLLNTRLELQVASMIDPRFPPCHGPTLSWAHPVMGLPCHGPTLSWAYLVMGLPCHGPTLSWAYPVMGPPCHWPTLPWAYLVMRLPCHGPTLSWAHPVMGPPCHWPTLSWAYPVMCLPCHGLPCHGPTLRSSHSGLLLCVFSQRELFQSPSPRGPEPPSRK